MKKVINLLGIIGLILLLYGLISAILYSNYYWYSYFVVGGTLFLGCINYLNKEKSSYMFKKDVFKFYIVYIIIAIFSEIIGRFILDLWYYPNFNFYQEVINVYLIGYPFALFFVYETFLLVKRKIKSHNLAVLTTTLVSAFFHEFPNAFASEWVYKIPYINFEVLNINIVVWVGWVILILIPVYINKKL